MWVILHYIWVIFITETDPLVLHLLGMAHVFITVRQKHHALIAWLNRLPGLRKEEIKREYVIIRHPGEVILDLVDRFVDCP